jgi:muconate cycloisomerase
MKVARSGGLWNASRIITHLHESGLHLYASGLTDTELSLAASLHLFSWAGLKRPAALNGPQYVADKGSSDPAFRANGDTIRIPGLPGLGFRMDPGAERSLTIAATIQ